MYTQPKTNLLVITGNCFVLCHVFTFAACDLAERKNCNFVGKVVTKSLPIETSGSR